MRTLHPTSDRFEQKGRTMSENHMKARERQFPSFDSVDGIEDELFSIQPVGHDVYHFMLMSRWNHLDRAEFPRDDIDRLLDLLDLPCSRFLEWNHRVVECDDLDSAVGPLDQSTYRLVVELDREDFAHYYKRMMRTPFVQEYFGYSEWSWRWRDLPLPPGASLPAMMVFEKPANRYSVATPLTRSKLRQLFSQRYPDTPAEVDLVICYTSDGCLFIEDSTEPRHRYELDRAHYILSTDLRDFFCGRRMRPISHPEAATPDDQ